MRILVIDDSQIPRLIARAAFEELGYEVLEAEDGETGLQIARDERPDCVFLDLLMPGMSGRDVLQVMQAELAEIPVIVITADDESSTEQECLQLGARAVMDKPRDPAELTDALRAVFPDRIE